MDKRRLRRRLGRGPRAGVNRDRDLNRAAELLGQRVDDQRPELGLEVFLNERVGSGDQRGILYQAEGPGEPEPGELASRQPHLGQAVKRPCPHIR